MIRLVELSTPSVTEFISRLCDQQVPFQSAMMLNSLRESITSGINEYEDSRIKLLTQFGKRRSDGALDTADGTVQFDDDKTKSEFLQELETLANRPFSKMRVKMTDLRSLTMTANDIELLLSLIEIC